MVYLGSNVAITKVTIFNRPIGKDRLSNSVVSLRDENNDEMAVYHFDDVDWDEYTILVADFTPPPPPPPPTRKYIHHLMYGKLCVISTY